MRRLLPALLALLLVAAPVPARAEEAPIDPARVARLLLSQDEAERAEGTRLLLQRIGAGGDLAGFLREMARAQAALAAGRDVPAPEAPPSGEAAHPTAAPPAPPAPPAAEPLAEDVPPPAQTAAGPGANDTPGPGEDTAQSGAPGETAELALHLVEVPVAAADETLSGLAVEPRARAWRAGADGQAHGLLGPQVLAATWREAARQATDADPLADFAGDVPLGRRVPTIRGRAIRIRKDVGRTKDGGWEVVPGALPTGYTLDVTATRREDGALRLVLVLRHAHVETPLVTRVTPAEGVDPIEIDRAEWETTSAEVTVTLPPSEAAVIRFPSLEPKAERVPLLIVERGP